MIYRKRGTSVRWEDGTIIRIAESGIAREEDGTFSCEPAAWGTPPPVPPDVALARVAEEIHALAHGLAIERLVLSAGVADHECDGRAWTEETRRVHLALTHRRMRALIDLGSFATEDIARVADALRRADGAERDAPRRLRLAANVAAAIVPQLVGSALPNVRVVQSAGGIDGRGQHIVEADGDWPNFYRPSYRVRPVRAALNVRLECAIDAIDREGPVAVALLAPPAGPTLNVLVDDGRRAWPATVRLTKIDAVAAERTWYPYGAGSFGAEMML